MYICRCFPDDTIVVIGSEDIIFEGHKCRITDSQPHKECLMYDIDHPEYRCLSALIVRGHIVCLLADTGGPVKTRKYFNRAVSHLNGKPTMNHFLKMKLKNGPQIELSQRLFDLNIGDIVHVGDYAFVAKSSHYSDKHYMLYLDHDHTLEFIFEGWKYICAVAFDGVRFEIEDIVY